MNIKKQNGITLIVLVVTIVVMLILVGGTVGMIFDGEGLLRKSAESKQLQQEYGNKEEAKTNELINDLDTVIKENNENKVVDISKVTSTNHKTLKAKDTKGNIITVPKGFRVKAESTTVQQGIVITDSENDDTQGNEFVWIPVGVVTKDDGSKSNEIKLGRYTFSTSSPGNPTLAAGTYQYAYTEDNPTNYTGSVSNIKDNNGYACHELVTRDDPTKNDGVASSGANGLNAIAKDLAGFVDSVRNNGGYYLARYEASCEAIQGETGIEYELVSKASNTFVDSSTFAKPTTVGQIKLWNGISQINAALESRKMYSNTDETIGVKSDLINSYAWDTAIVYIQEMGNLNFTNKNRDNVGSIRIANTGSNSKDKSCNIYDMIANIYEWSTEYSTGATSARPCVMRGGAWVDNWSYTGFRYAWNYSAITVNTVGFRTLLYVTD